MKGQIITEAIINDFKIYLQNEEKSANTIEKYIRDIRAFYVYADNIEITKEMVIAYKNKLISNNYAIRSINSMIAALNSLSVFSA